MAIKYKLTTQDMTTNSVFQWEVGKEYVIDKPGTDLCSNQVFHYYDSPELAVLLNRIHADINDPRLWAVECDVVANDGLKGGSKRMKLLWELPLPEFSTQQRAAFALLCVLEVYDAPEFRRWAEGWLSGADRSRNSAAAVTVWTEAERTAAAAMESSARSVLWSAQSAQLAIWSVRSAIRSVELAAQATEAAEAAEESARAAEMAVKTGKLLNLQQIAKQALAYTDAGRQQQNG